MKGASRSSRRRRVRSRLRQEDILAGQEWDQELDPFTFYFKCLKLCLMEERGLAGSPRVGGGMVASAPKSWDRKRDGALALQPSMEPTCPSPCAPKSCTENAATPASPVNVAAWDTEGSGSPLPASRNRASLCPRGGYCNWAGSAAPAPSPHACQTSSDLGLQW